MELAAPALSPTTSKGWTTWKELTDCATTTRRCALEQTAHTARISTDAPDGLRVRRAAGALNFTPPAQTEALLRTMRAFAPSASAQGETWKLDGGYVAATVRTTGRSMPLRRGRASTSDRLRPPPSAGGRRAARRRAQRLR